MIAKAKSTGEPIEFLEADAKALPFSDDAFDVVTARHMLYHVLDIPRALSEARRVLRPDGRFLAVTNIHDNMGDYRSALCEAADQVKGQIACAMRIVVPASDVFNERNGPAMIKSVFGNVAVTFVESALRFDTVEAPLRYFDSCRTMKGVNREDWAVAREAFGRVIARRLSSGPWTVAKTVVLFTATAAK